MELSELILSPVFGGPRAVVTVGGLEVRDERNVLLRMYRLVLDADSGEVVLHEVKEHRSGYDCEVYREDLPMVDDAADLSEGEPVPRVNPIGMTGPSVLSRRSKTLDVRKKEKCRKRRTE